MSLAILKHAGRPMAASLGNFAAQSAMFCSRNIRLVTPRGDVPSARTEKLMQFIQKMPPKPLPKPEGTAQKLMSSPAYQKAVQKHFPAMAALSKEDKMKMKETFESCFKELAKKDGYFDPKKIKHTRHKSRLEKVKENSGSLHESPIAKLSADNIEQLRLESADVLRKIKAQEAAARKRTGPVLSRSNEQRQLVDNNPLFL